MERTSGVSVFTWRSKCFWGKDIRKGTNVSMAMVKRVLVVMLVAVVAGGCASTPKGPTDAELVQQRIENFKAALLAKDVDKVLMNVSENFYHPEVGDKAGARDIMQQGIDSGFTEGGQVDLSNMQIKIEKDTATAYPIIASAAPGSVTVGLTLKKEKAKDGTLGWYITEINVEGI